MVKLNAYASMNTKNLQKKANISSKIDNSEVSADSYSEVKEAKPGSMMSKANMVRDYNEKNSRKQKVSLIIEEVNNMDMIEVSAKTVRN